MECLSSTEYRGSPLALAVNQAYCRSLLLSPGWRKLFSSSLVSKVSEERKKYAQSVESSRSGWKVTKMGNIHNTYSHTSMLMYSTRRPDTTVGDMIQSVYTAHRYSYNRRQSYFEFYNNSETLDFFDVPPRSYVFLRVPARS